MLGVDVSGTGIAVASGVIAAAAACFLAINSWLKDRGEREEKHVAKEETAHATDKTEIARQGRVLDHLTVTMVGRPADLETGLPAIPGFVDEQRDHNREVDGQLATLNEEITTDNGGGTIKGSMKLLRSEVASLRQTVEQGSNGD